MFKKIFAALVSFFSFSSKSTDGLRGEAIALLTGDEGATDGTFESFVMNYSSFYFPESMEAFREIFFRLKEEAEERIRIHNEELARMETRLPGLSANTGSPFKNEENRREAEVLRGDIERKKNEILREAKDLPEEQRKEAARLLGDAHLRIAHEGEILISTNKDSATLREERRVVRWEGKIFLFLIEFKVLEARKTGSHQEYRGGGYYRPPVLVDIDEFEVVACGPPRICWVTTSPSQFGTEELRVASNG